eukprot:COSAG05_NODE_332_length_11268_cov_132.023726_10_plen_260_part_00
MLLPLLPIALYFAVAADPPLNVLDVSEQIRLELRLDSSLVTTPAATAAVARQTLGLPAAAAGTPLREDLQQICTQVGIETRWVPPTSPSPPLSGQGDDGEAEDGGGEPQSSEDVDPWLEWEQVPWAAEAIPWIPGSPGTFNRTQGVRLLTAADYRAPRTFYIREWQRVWVVLFCTPEQPRQCGPSTARLWASLAHAFRNDSRVEIALLTTVSGSPEQELGGRFGAWRARAIQIFHMHPDHYAAGVSVPLYPLRQPHKIN